MTATVSQPSCSENVNLTEKVDRISRIYIDLHVNPGNHVNPVGSRQSNSAFCRRRVDYRLHLCHVIRRKSASPRVFVDHLLIWSDVNAIDLIIGNITFDPLNTWSKLV